MIKNITFTADETLIQRARQRAAMEDKSLNELFREWLIQYVARQEAAEQYDELMARLGTRFDRTFTREELNERG